MRGVTFRMTPRLVYWIWEPPVVLAVPAVTLMMGEARVTSIRADSLSKVTVRGEEMTLASAYLLRKESTALRPSAFRKKVSGLKPPAVVAPRPPAPMTEFKTVLTALPALEFTVRPLGRVVVWLAPPMVVVLWPDMIPLPKETCWPASVPDQSTPLLVLGLIEVSSRRASMSTCRVWVSSLSIKSSTPGISFSVARTTSWLVRMSATTLLRLSVKVFWTAIMMLVGAAYLSWMILVTSGSGAAGSLRVMRAILLLGSSVN